jgi:hypothetical protein
MISKVMTHNGTYDAGASQRTRALAHYCQSAMCQLGCASNTKECDAHCVSTILACPCSHSRRLCSAANTDVRVTPVLMARNIVLTLGCSQRACITSKHAPPGHTACRYRLHQARVCMSSPCHFSCTFLLGMHLEVAICCHIKLMLSHAYSVEGSCTTTR